MEQGLESRDALQFGLDLCSKWQMCSVRTHSFLQARCVRLYALCTSCSQVLHCSIHGHAAATVLQSHWWQYCTRALLACQSLHHLYSQHGCFHCMPVVCRSLPHPITHSFTGQTVQCLNQIMQANRYDWAKVQVTVAGVIATLDVVCIQILAGLIANM